jgi:hypothetical protein
MRALTAVVSIPFEVDEIDEIEVRLAGLVRPEFNVVVVRPDINDPVLAGPCCTVVDCVRPARSHGLCAAHHSRWVLEPVKFFV